MPDFQARKSTHVDSQWHLFIRWHYRPRISQASAVSRGLFWAWLGICRLRLFIALFVYFFFPRETCCPDKTWKNTGTDIAKAKQQKPRLQIQPPGPEVSRNCTGGTRAAWGKTQAKDLLSTCLPCLQRAALWSCYFPMNREIAEPVLSKISFFLQHHAEMP